jgi:dolichol-phosphate hexosyltransferase
MAKKVKGLVTIILPTYNEAETIVPMITGIKKLNKKFPIEIIVVDSGSPDGTAMLAEKAGVKVIKYRKKRGKGADFWAGAKAATGEYIIQIDADNQFSPTEIPAFVKALQNGADVAIAHRIDHSEAPFIRTLGNRLFVIAATVVLGRRIHDLVAGFKAFKTDVLLDIKITEPHFGYEAEVVAKTVRKGYKLVEIPVEYKPRRTGVSQVSPLRDGVLTILSLLKARFGAI